MRYKRNLKTVFAVLAFGVGVYVALSTHGATRISDNSVAISPSGSEEKVSVLQTIENTDFIPSPTNAFT